MAVRAHLQNGNHVLLAGDETAASLIERLTSGSLTGSAAFLDDVWLPTSTGGVIRGNAITMFEDISTMFEDPSQPS